MTQLATLLTTNDQILLRIKPIEQNSLGLLDHLNRIMKVPAANPRQHLSSLPMMFPERTGDEHDPLSKAMAPLSEEKRATRSN